MSQINKIEYWERRKNGITTFHPAAQFIFKTLSLWDPLLFEKKTLALILGFVDLEPSCARLRFPDEKVVAKVVYSLK